MNNFIKIKDKIIFNLQMHKIMKEFQIKIINQLDILLDRLIRIINLNSKIFCKIKNTKKLIKMLSS